MDLHTQMVSLISKQIAVFNKVYNRIDNSDHIDSDIKEIDIIYQEFKKFASDIKTKREFHKYKKSFKKSKIFILDFCVLVDDVKKIKKLRNEIKEVQKTYDKVPNKLQSLRLDRAWLDSQ